jgi:hypothetical protein
MRIIKEGKSRVIRFECDECGCIYEEDAKNCNREIICMVEFYYTCCPCCGKRHSEYVGEKEE